MAQWICPSVRTLRSPFEDLDFTRSVARAACKIDGRKLSKTARLLQNNAKLPPVIVYLEAGKHRLWITDGFHRVAACSSIGQRSISCEVRVGSRHEIEQVYAQAQPIDTQNASATFKPRNEEKTAESVARCTQARYRPTELLRQTLAGITMTAMLLSFVFPPYIFAQSQSNWGRGVGTVPVRRVASTDNRHRSILGAIFCSSKHRLMLPTPSACRSTQLRVRISSRAMRPNFRLPQRRPRSMRRLLRAPSILPPAHIMAR